MDYVNAFWVGGAICALVQILMEKTKLMPGRIMVLLVCGGAVLRNMQAQAQAFRFSVLEILCGKESKRPWIQTDSSESSKAALQQVPPESVRHWCSDIWPAWYLIPK